MDSPQEGTERLMLSLVHSPLYKKSEEKIFYIIYIKVNLTTNHYHKLLWSSESFEVEYNIGFGIPIEFPSQRRKKIFKSVNKLEIGLLWSGSHLRESTIMELESPSNF